MKLLIVLALLMPLAAAHLCVISPHQRGTMDDLNTQGAKDCLLLDMPCGKREGTMPRVMFAAGMKNNIVFQKNLDHFNMKKPGMFMINIADDMKQPVKWTSLWKTPDTNTTSGTLYDEMVMFPDMEMEHAVLQVVYMTNNPDAPPNFYQCADISVKKMH